MEYFPIHRKNDLADSIYYYGHLHMEGNNAIFRKKISSGFKRIFADPVGGFKAVFCWIFRSVSADIPCHVVREFR